jgi:ferredoxin
MAFENGMGKDKIDVLGEKVEAVRISSFQFPTPSQIDWGLPKFLSKALKNALTSIPMMDQEICKRCDRCTEICPPKALTKGGKDLIFDYRQCIRCFCCLEVCQEGAVKIEPGWALKLAGRKQKAAK